MQVSNLGDSREKDNVLKEMGVVVTPPSFADEIKRLINGDLSTLPNSEIRRWMLRIPQYVIFLRHKANKARADAAKAEAEYERVYNQVYIQQEGSIADKERKTEIISKVEDAKNKMLEAEERYRMLKSVPDDYLEILQVLKRVFDANMQEKKITSYEQRDE